MTFELEKKKHSLLSAPSIILSVAHTKLPADAADITSHWPRCEVSNTRCKKTRYFSSSEPYARKKAMQWGSGRNWTTPDMTWAAAGMKIC